MRSDELVIDLSHLLQRPCPLLSCTSFMREPFGSVVSGEQVTFVPMDTTSDGETADGQGRKYKKTTIYSKHPTRWKDSHGNVSASFTWGRSGSTLGSLAARIQEWYSRPLAAGDARFHTIFVILKILS